ncbi:hypothetical protein, partial [Staphylococcus agnetis]|uniref:hypothetical protein n=1 Tax=Staphylococcus agnetis TaxID=985762 RepID=UPI001ADC0B94
VSEGTVDVIIPKAKSVVAVFVHLFIISNHLFYVYCIKVEQLIIVLYAYIISVFKIKLNNYVRIFIIFKNTELVHI